MRHEPDRVLEPVIAAIIGDAAVLALSRNWRWSGERGSVEVRNGSVQQRLALLASGFFRCLFVVDDGG